MIQKRQLTINAAMSSVQVVVVGISFFVLYRYLLDTIGEEDFGVWAVVLATTSASHIASLGLAASTVKYVSKYLAREDPASVRAVIETAAISVAVVLLVVLVGAYPLLKKLLAFLIEPDAKVPAAHSILAYALASFWLTNVGLVFQSCVDGLQRIDLRAVLVSVIAVVYVALAFVMVPRGGLIGLAQAQVIQAALLAVGMWLLLRSRMRHLPLVPWRFSWDSFKEMFSYSVNFQAISVASMLFEPTTSSLVSKFGGVGMAGFYEMARRMVVQIRALIVSAHQAIVPTLADLEERDPSSLRNIYRVSFRVLVYVIAFTLPGLIALTPAAGIIWLGYNEPLFVLFAILLFLGWFLGMFANPAYYANMGTGRLRWNVVGHAVIGIVNLGLGVLLGLWVGGTGVVIATAVAILVGSWTIAIAYHRSEHFTVRQFVDGRSLWLAASSLVAMSISLAVFYVTLERLGIGAAVAVAAVIYVALIAVPVWRHPLRPGITDWFREVIARPPEE